MKVSPQLKQTCIFLHAIPQIATSSLFAYLDELCEQVLQSLKKGRNVNGMYNDKSNASNKVDFLITLTKLNRHSISGKFGNCFLKG